MPSSINKTLANTIRNASASGASSIIKFDSPDYRREELHEAWVLGRAYGQAFRAAEMAYDLGCQHGFKEGYGKLARSFRP